MDDNKGTIIRNLILITLGVMTTLFLLVVWPEGSDRHTILSFFIGGGLGFTQSKSVLKMDILLKYSLVTILFLLWYFFIPNPLMSVLFLLGALTGLSLKRELKENNK